MAPQILALLGGLLGLYVGAEWVVRGSARLARALGISALVVGLTVVSMGTSAPELVVSLLAATRGQTAIAVGNVIGSNIVNVAVIVGAAAALAPLTVHSRLVAREIPVMIGASILAMALATDGSLGRWNGLVLVLALALYMLFMVRSAREEEVVESSMAALRPRQARQRQWVRDLLLLTAGCVVLVLGAHLLVDSAVFFAEVFGISEAVIGITIVAIGTSLPELATTVVAAVRGETDIALGNAVGSNVFNVLAVLGISAIVHPLDVPTVLFRFEIPVMLAFSIVLLPAASSRRRIGRWEGLGLLLGYALFTLALLDRL